MALKALSDEELMALYQEGAYEIGMQAFQELYARHSGKVFGYLKNKVRNEALASDIFQDVFMKLHKSKSLYKKTLPFKPWLFTIARSALIDEMRKSKRHLASERDLENLEDQSKAFESGPGAIASHLEKLPSSQKAVLEMRYVEDQTFEEIAVALKTSEVNARQIVNRARHRLRDLMETGKKYDKAK